ncbi:hypothetical protein LCGC14_2124040, partial [marine sediment metagenome]
FGHSAGDRMLYRVAAALSQQCRESDLPVRYGGEEFALLVPNESVEGGANLAERCRRAVEDIRLNTLQDAIGITASFGVAGSTGLSKESELIEAADRALYRAKEAGRNLVAIAAGAGKAVLHHQRA